jgi:hypothetical protein
MYTAFVEVFVSFWPIERFHFRCLQHDNARRRFSQEEATLRHRHQLKLEVKMLQFMVVCEAKM